MSKPVVIKYAAIIDSQSVKTLNWQLVEGLMRIRKSKIYSHRYDWRLGVKVTDANISDNQVAIELLTEIFSWQITIQLVCADAGYRGKLGDWLYLTHQCHPPTSWAILRHCGAHLFLVRLVSPIDFGL